MLRSSAGSISPCLSVLLVAGGFTALGQQPQPTGQRQPAASAQRSLINQYCVGCHNDKAKTGGLALDTANVENISQAPEVWEKVLHKVRARYMPPIGMPRPDEKAYQSLVSYLETSLDQLSAANPNPGRTATLRRLTRTEYQNAIRDLLDLQVDVTQLLPNDESSFGFDNITVGELSPTLLERYLAAARKISRLAVGSPVRSPAGETILIPPDLTQEEHLDELPFGTRGGAAVPYTFPQDGEYEIQLQLSRDRNEHIEGLGEPTEIELLLDGARVQVFTVTPVNNVTGIRNANSIPSDDQVDKHLHIRLRVKAGPHTLGVTFPKKPSLLLETERQPYLAHFNMYRHPRINPALYSIVVVGPYYGTGAADTPSRRRLFVCRPAKAAEEESCAKQILWNFARRAYRRPVTDADTQIPLKLYREVQAGSGFDAGIERGLRALLISPEFLFRVEQDPANMAPNTAYRLTDLELASRLSFFLWSSIPDDELLELAIGGKLKDPTVLEKQVRRMLSDARAEALVNNFADQWLYLRNLQSIIPDARAFPDFDDNLRQAIRRETELFFESIMRENRNVLDLLSANYTFVNERLAKHYGIPNVFDSYFRRVTFDGNSVRGGLLGQASILTVTSYADRTSPVIRGKWVLTNILGSPPPPPPGNVPPLKNDGNATGKALTMRERMAAHRVNQPCAGCHRLMDPVGFALENYDAVGRWRTTDQDVPIDASGNLPDGSQFVGVAGLRQALLSRPDLFVTTLTEKLLTYALGRGLESYDGAAVRKIVRDARDDDYRFSSLILGVVNSTPFQMRRSQ